MKRLEATLYFSLVTWGMGVLPFLLVVELPTTIPAFAFAALAMFFWRAVPSILPGLKTPPPEAEPEWRGFWAD